MNRKILYFPREGNGLNHLAIFDDGEEFKTSHEGFLAYTVFDRAGFDNFELARNADEVRKLLEKTEYKKRLIFSHPNINFTNIEQDLERAVNSQTYIILFSGHDELNKPLGKYHPENHRGLHRIVRASDIYDAKNLTAFIRRIVSRA